MMTADAPDLLTTGQAAKLCSVTPDTILKWIKKGRLRGVRTAGGHYRIHRKDLQPLITSTGRLERASRQLPECYSEQLRCWEYLSDSGTIRDDCRQCIVYRVRAARCFLMVGSESSGHARQFCQSSCEDCVYYRRMKGLAANVLVITSDEELAERLTREENESINLRFARNAYEASAMMHDFRPALAVVDQEQVTVGTSDLIRSLLTDSRVPGLRIIVVVPPGMKGLKYRRPTSEGVVGVLEKPFGSRRITAVIDSVPVDTLMPEDSNV